MKFDNLKNKEFWINLIRKNYIFILAILISIVVYVGWSYQLTGNIQSDLDLIQLDRTHSIAGIDANKNGIRDDIDQYIEKLNQKENFNQPQLKAIQQSARAMQALLTVDYTNKSAVLKAGELDDKALNCMTNQFGAKFGIPEYDFQRLTVNTRERTKAYIEINKVFDGGVYSLTNGDTCVP